MPLRHTQVKGCDGIYHTALGEMVEGCLPEVSIDWKLANVMPNVQEGSERASRGVRTCQPDFSPGEDHGADHPECHDTAQTGQLGDQAQAAWV